MFFYPDSYSFGILSLHNLYSIESVVVIRYIVTHYSYSFGILSLPHNTTDLYGQEQHKISHFTDWEKTAPED